MMSFKRQPIEDEEKNICFSPCYSSMLTLLLIPFLSFFFLLALDFHWKKKGAKHGDSIHHSIQLKKEKKKKKRQTFL